MTQTQAFQSALLRSASYDPARRVLTLVFVRGFAYKYANVPAGVWEGLCGAPSPGAFYNAKIRNRFQAPA